MSETGREIPVGLNEFHVVRLFKCAESGVFAPTLLVFVSSRVSLVFPSFQIWAP